MTEPTDTAEPSGASGGSVTAGIRKCIAAHEQISWGWDGDCGANDIISRIEEECDKIDAARPAPTLTDAEREAVEWAAEMMEVGSLPNSLNRGDARVLRSLLERLC